jgi:hypothetical protein
MSPQEWARIFRAGSDKALRVNPLASPAQALAEALAAMELEAIAIAREGY